MKPNHQNRESGTEIGKAVKADEISVVEPTQPLHLARQSTNNKEARTFVPASLLFYTRLKYLNVPSWEG